MRGEERRNHNENMSQYEISSGPCNIRLYFKQGEPQLEGVIQQAKINTIKAKNG